MDLLKAIVDAWKWKGIEPVEIVDQNAFGNVIVRTTTGHFWRICPEELSATKLANDEEEFDRLRHGAEFIADWDMVLLVQRAREILGEPDEGRCYCLKMLGVFGGKYDDSNLATINLSELLAVSGSLAKQIDDVPDGSKIQLKIGKPPL